MQLPSPTAQAPQAAPTAGTSPTDCALCRRPPPLGCRGGGGGEVRHELTVWVRPAGSLGQSSGALLTQPPACTCPCPTVQLLAPGPASCRDPGRRPGSPSYLSLHLRTPLPHCWLKEPSNSLSSRRLAGGGARCSPDQWLSGTANGRSLTAARLVEEGAVAPVVLPVAEQPSGVLWQPLPGNRAGGNGTAQPSESVKVLVAQPCLTVSLWTVARQALSPRNSPGENTGVGCHSFSRGSA